MCHVFIDNKARLLPVRYRSYTMTTNLFVCRPITKYSLLHSYHITSLLDKHIEPTFLKHQNKKVSKQVTIKKRYVPEKKR